MEFNEEFWVAIAFLMFVGLMLYLKVPSMLGKTLDQRSQKIKQDLDEAARLRAEAMVLFEEYRQKQQNAMQVAAEIVAHAEAEAKRIAKQAEVDLRAALERRRVMAETKIAQAEAAAVKEVRDIAVDIAIAAARDVLVQQLKGPAADQLIAKATSDMQGKLH